MAAKQAVIRTLSNPKAKYKLNYIKYMIEKDGKTYTGTRKYITRKADEWTN